MLWMGLTVIGDWVFFSREGVWKMPIKDVNRH